MHHTSATRTQPKLLVAFDVVEQAVMLLHTLA